MFAEIGGIWLFFIPFKILVTLLIYQASEREETLA